MRLARLLASLAGDSKSCFTQPPAQRNHDIPWLCAPFFTPRGLVFSQCLREKSHLTGNVSAHGYALDQSQICNWGRALRSHSQGGIFHRDTWFFHFVKYARCWTHTIHIIRTGLKQMLMGLVVESTSRMCPRTVAAVAIRLSKWTHKNLVLGCRHNSCIIEIHIKFAGEKWKL